MGYLPVNVAGVAPAEDFVYPAGEYILQVKETKVEPTKDGTGFRLLVKSEILMGPGPSLDLQGKPFTHSFALTEKSRMFLVQFAQACGLQAQIDAAGGQVDSDWFPGCQYLAFITQKDGYFNATKLRPAAAWTHGGGAGQPAMAPQPGMQSGLLQPMPGQAPAPMAAPPMAAPPMAAPPMQQPQQPQIPAPQAAPPMAAPGNGQQGYAAPPAPQPQFQQSAVGQPQQPQAGFPAPPPPGQIPGQGQGQ